jgi:uncharacterized protein YvpB
MPRARTPVRSRQPPIFTRRTQATRARRRRRLMCALIAVAAAVGIGLLLAGRNDGSAATPPARAMPDVLTLAAGNAVIARIRTGRYVRAGRIQTRAVLRLVSAVLPETSTSVAGRVEMTYAYDAAATAARAGRLGVRGGRVAAVRRTISTRIQAPVRRQQQANTCEAAALSILLSTLGRAEPESRIQRALPTSGTQDPQGTGAARIWGDPDRGYVGRPNGGGTAGGFGVYPAPVRATAAGFGVRLRDLTRLSPSAVYASLLAGHAVMAWVGLSDGPTSTWTSPQGRAITVNFGEHTVVLHGIRDDGAILVSNPLRGTRETWSPATFERMWDLLGRRAVGT